MICGRIRWNPAHSILFLYIHILFSDIGSIFVPDAGGAQHVLTLSRSKHCHVLVHVHVSHRLSVYTSDTLLTHILEQRQPDTNVKLTD